MDVVRLRIPFEFIGDRFPISWRAILFGLQNELLDPAAPMSLAAEQLTKEENSSATLIELAGLSGDEDPSAYVERLARDTPEEAVEEIRSKWVCIVLTWIYEHKDEYEDPLQAVEEVYADFDYPERIAGFVRYMPCNESDLGSRELNEARLFDRWKEYLGKCSSEFIVCPQANSGGA
jgi:hypothetical protein